MFFVVLHVGHAVDGTKYGGVIDEVAVYDDVSQINAIVDGVGNLFKVDAWLNVGQQVNANELSFMNTSAKQCSFDNGRGMWLCEFDIAKSLGEGDYTETLSYSPAIGISDQVSVNFYVDAGSPTLNNFNLRRTFDNKLEVKFSAVDARSGGKCGGLKGFILYNGPEVYASEEFGSSLCDLTDHTVEVALPSVSGNYNFVLEVFDIIGHRSNQITKGLSIDISPPEMGEISLRSVTGIELDELLVGRNTYVIRAEINEANFAGATADLSNLGGRTNVTGDCEQVGDTNYWCEWEFSALIEQSPPQRNGLVRAFDAHGNSNTKQFSFRVNDDSTGPAIDEYYTGLESKIFGVNPTDLIVRFSDESGIDFETVYADLRGLNPIYESSVGPEFCSDDTCVWPGLVPGVNVNGPVQLTVVAKDIGGNRIEKLIDIIVNKNNPQILRITQNNDFPTASSDIAEDLVFFAYYSSVNGIYNASLNADSIAPGVGEVEGICDFEKCEFTISYTDLITQSTSGVVEFILYDKAGNFMEREWNVNVYETSTEEAPQEVRIVAGDFAPKKLDRNLATLTPIKVFLPLRFIHQENVFIRDARVSCEDLELFYPADETRGYYLMPSNAIATTIFLDETTSQLNSIPFNCTITMRVGRDDVIYTLPEIEQVYAPGKQIPSLPLYNKRLGDIGENTLSKILDIQEDIEVLDSDVFQTVRKVFEIGKRLCDYMDILNQIYNVVETLKPIVYSISQIVNAISGTGDAIWQAFLKAECHVRGVKEWAWPTSVYYGDILGDSEVGFFESLAGGSQSPSEAAGFADKGWVRRICAGIMCSQCSNGFGLATELSDMLDEEIGIGREDVQAPVRAGTVPEPKLLPGEVPEIEEETKTEEKDGGITFTGGVTVEASELDLDIFDGVSFERRLNPYDNIFVSAQCGCLPGVVHNLEKLRQIKCKYASCLRTSAENAMSTAYCEDLYQQDRCLWFTNGLFDILPVTGILRSFMIDIRNFVTELPGNLVVAVKEYACSDVMERANTPGFGEHVAWQGSINKCVDAVGSVSIAGTTDAVEQIVCGLTDAAMLAFSWNHYRDNSLEFTKADFWDFDQSGQDLCEGVFDELPTVGGENGGGEPSTPTSVPGGTG